MLDGDRCFMIPLDVQVTWQLRESNLDMCEAYRPHRPSGVLISVYGQIMSVCHGQRLAD